MIGRQVFKKNTIDDKVYLRMTLEDLNSRFVLFCYYIVPSNQCAILCFVLFLIFVYKLLGE